jgi:tetratricopeptide (TPR) repeat protein
MRKLLGVGVVVSAVCVWSCLGFTAVAGSAPDDPCASIAEADRLFDRWSMPFDFEAYEASLRGAIALWEEALPGLPEANVQSRSHVLNRLAQAYFELGEGYLSDASEKEEAYEAGKDAALASMRLDPTFDATEASDGFRAALLSATDVAAIFWYGNALGQWLNYNVFTAVVMGGVRDVAASFERSIELDETYDGAGPHRAMAALLSQAHFLIGRDRQDAVDHFERCIELAANHLEAYVSYAEFYARPTGDVALFDALIVGVLEKAMEPTIMAAFPFYNKLSIDRANALAAGD